MNFPSLQSATDYLRESLQEFYNQSQVLKDRLVAIGKLKQEAQKRSDQYALGRLIVLQAQVKQLFIEQLALEQRLAPFGEYFGVRMTLGLLPVVLAVGAVGVATALYLHFEKLKNQAKALDLIAKGLLPADQADAILNPSFFSGLGGSFASVGMLAVGGIFLFLFLTRR